MCVIRSNRSSLYCHIVRVKLETPGCTANGQRAGIPGINGTQAETGSADHSRHLRFGGKCVRSYRFNVDNSDWLSQEELQMRIDTLLPSGRLPSLPAL